MGRTGQNKDGCPTGYTRQIKPRTTPTAWHRTTPKTSFKNLAAQERMCLIYFYDLQKKWWREVKYTQLCGTWGPLTKWPWLQVEKIQEKVFRNSYKICSMLGGTPHPSVMRFLHSTRGSPHTSTQTIKQSSKIVCTLPGRKNVLEILSVAEQNLNNCSHCLMNKGQWNKDTLSTKICLLKNLEMSGSTAHGPGCNGWTVNEVRPRDLILYSKGARRRYIQYWEDEKSKLPMKINVNAKQQKNNE